VADDLHQWSCGTAFGLLSLLRNARRSVEPSLAQTLHKRHDQFQTLGEYLDPLNGAARARASFLE
jgi:hypothetical protein